MILADNTKRHNISGVRVTFNFHDQKIFRSAPLCALLYKKSRLLNFYYGRGILFFHLGRYKRAAADFSKVLRLDWRNERVVLWIGRAERAHRATLLPASGNVQEFDGVAFPLSVWDRPTCHRFAYAGT
ncbi:tetratricopeptide repeat protein [Microvirga subterranea]|uniref:Uncharacterized protein n=1 Tax=Microvirga subterranea TaxID=186651 RepID=A0A370HI55_9HYPH|nr:tetratricopeptide repeat protein [Microvirga subterranea]RDI57093.1 hypothetical protein DES45_1077 [Microvirga subterranea]